MKRMVARVSPLGFASLLFLQGCSGDGGSGGGACNALVDDGPKVSLVALAQVAPAPQGGMFADGIYELAGATLYTGPGGSTSSPSVAQLSAVFEISGNTMQQVGTIDGELRRYTSTFATSGTTVSTTDTCPQADSGSHSFTAIASEFSIYDAASGGTLEQRYERR